MLRLRCVESYWSRLALVYCWLVSRWFVNSLSARDSRKTRVLVNNYDASIEFGSSWIRMHEFSKGLWGHGVDSGELHVRHNSPPSSHTCCPRLGWLAIIHPVKLILQMLLSSPTTHPVKVILQILLSSTLTTTITTTTTTTTTSIQYQATVSWTRTAQG